MPKISFISSFLVITKKCFRFRLLLFTFVLFNFVNCLTLLSANQLNVSLFGYKKWSLIGLSKQTNRFTALNTNDSSKNHSLNIFEVKNSDVFGNTRKTSDEFLSQYVLNSYSLASNSLNDKKINGKYKSKVERSVTNSGKTMFAFIYSDFLYK